MKNIINLLPFLLLLLPGCKKPTAPYQPVQLTCTRTYDIDSIKTWVAGTWKFLEEKRVNRRENRFDYITPATLGYQEKMMLRNDTAWRYKNNDIVGTYKFKIIKQLEITGTSFPDDELPVLAFYELRDGSRASYVPLRMCSNYMILQYQFISSIVGEEIWERQ